MRILSRRTLLAGGGGVLALGLAGFAGSRIACGGGGLTALLPLDRFGVALADIPDPVRLGGAYARLGAPTEDLWGKPGLLGALRQDCDLTRRAEIRAQFQRDFAQGDVLLVERWVVSRSECIVAALCWEQSLV